MCRVTCSMAETLESRRGPERHLAKWAPAQGFDPIWMALVSLVERGWDVRLRAPACPPEVCWGSRGQRPPEVVAVAVPQRRHQRSARMLQRGEEVEFLSRRRR
mmetsp:Transcript_83270/g.233300  ORF Transcript_83270/g.233300 Transcript_83270/m.233300 type:complete len:103 (+) Transcript_83270:409-717(+)